MGGQSAATDGDEQIRTRPWGQLMQLRSNGSMPMATSFGGQGAAAGAEQIRAGKQLGRRQDMLSTALTAAANAEAAPAAATGAAVALGPRLNRAYPIGLKNLGHLFLSVG